MSKRKYLAALKTTAEAYTKGGVQAAIDKANKLGYTKLMYCQACETEQPVIEESYRNESGVVVASCDCGVCGSTIHPHIGKVSLCHS